MTAPPSDRYEWLEKEMTSVKTPKFFLTWQEPLPAPHDDIKLPEFPPSYVEFVHRFGEAKFYREHGGHLVRVLAVPRRQMDDGDTYWHVGGYDSSHAYLKEVTSEPGSEWPVVEDMGSLAYRADSFDDWLQFRCRTAKARYGAKEWRRIVDGPAPFTPEESSIVEARKKFRWKFLGVDHDGVMRFEVMNGSDRRMPYLSVGIYNARYRSWFAVRLGVAHIAPQTSAVAKHKLPPGTFGQGEIVPYWRGDPAPEDRELYGEFRPFQDDASEQPPSVIEE